MNTFLETKFIECLDALERGESVDKILTRYPHDADQLRALLETAVRLSKLNVQPSLAAQARSRDTFLAEAAAQKEAQSVRPPRWPSLRRILLPLASLILILVIFGAVLAPLSAAALPGDTLYGAKRFIEDTRVSLSADPAARAALNEEFGQRRIQEINALLAANRNAQVSFEGAIEDIQPDSWVIAGLSIQITDETRVVGGEPVVGQGAMVNGRTQSGSLVASTITLSPVTEPPAPTPTHTATPTITASSTPTATSEPATETATPTTSATATATVEPVPTDTIQPTDTPPPLPTPTATSDPDDDNDNENNDNGDDGNSNEDDNDNGGDENNGNDNSNDNDDDSSNDDSSNDDSSNDDSSNDNDNDNNNDDDDNNNEGNDNDDDD